MRGLIFLFAAAAWAQTARQGDTLRLRHEGETARMNGRTVRLYPDPKGGRLGLMPVPATMKPGPYKLEYLGANGAVLEEASVTVRSARFPAQNVVIAPRLAALKPAPGESEAVGAFRDAVSDTRYWSEPFALPVRGCMTSQFGVRRLLNGKPTGNYHAGIDQRAAAGQPIRAITAGVVKIARQFALHGGTVAIDHGQGLESIYLHMSKLAAVEGAAVKQGDVIGYAGSTGRSTAPHLHWSMYVNGVPVNPALWVMLKPCGTPAQKRKSAAPR